MQASFCFIFPFSRAFFGRARTFLYLLCKFDGVKSSNLLSRPTRGAWIEISTTSQVRRRRHSRAPHGARGLKSDLSYSAVGLEGVSRPTRGAWIEMAPALAPAAAPGSRPTRGAWIEMSSRPPRAPRSACRAPHGARGLKSMTGRRLRRSGQVAPHTGRVD